MPTIGTYLQQLSDLQNAVNPHIEIGNWLDLFTDPDAVSALVQSGAGARVAEGARLVEQSLASPDGSWQPGTYGGASTIYGGNTATGRYQAPSYTDPEPGVALEHSDAIANLRRLQLGIDPGTTQRLRQGFMASPEAQGATEATRRRGAGAEYRNRFGLSHYRDFDSSTQRRIGGEASAFGRSSQDFSRDILGNTPGGRGSGAPRMNSAFRRV